MKWVSFPSLLFIGVLSLNGCQTNNRLKHEDFSSDIKEYNRVINPSAALPRMEETPLIAVIPGLNVPGAPVGHKQFGNLIPLLEQEGFPSFVVAYDETVHPLSEMAGLFSQEHSIALNRVLPLLQAGINRENEIRKKQNTPPLKEVVLVSYSQGSILAMEIFRYLFGFQIDLQKFVTQTGEEWSFLKDDPEFLRFKDKAQNFLVLKTILAGNEKKYFQDYLLQRFSDRLSQDLADSIAHMKDYITSPEKIYPSQPIFSENKTGYPRRYPKISAWMKETRQPITFWMKYVELEPFLSVQLRFFSMAGSFFGSPEANRTTDYLQMWPQGLHKLFVGHTEKQIRDTRVGTRNHLNLIKAILKYNQEMPDADASRNTYYIVGAHGHQGDGVVPQSSAHLFSQLPLSKIDAPAKPEKLPRFGVTGLPIYHLSRKKLFASAYDSVAFIQDKKNIVYPFLLAFLRKDFNALNAQCQKKTEPLVQFMVMLALPLSGELDEHRFKLKPQSNAIDIDGRYDNKSSHAIVWTGYFKGKNPLAKSSVRLLMSKEEKHVSAIDLQVLPGLNHFLEITDTEEKEEDPYLLGLPHIFVWNEDGVTIKLPKQEEPGKK